MIVKQLNVNQNAVLTAYLLDQSPEFMNIDYRPAVLIFPGGGYYFTSDREAEPVAMAYLAEGFHAFVLRYSVGMDQDFRTAFNDAGTSIDLIRDHWEEWRVDPNQLSVVGFSAGGHLAVALGTMGKNKPNALILGYPCILSTSSDVLAFPVPSLEQKVDEHTPPTFLFATVEDQTVPIENTLSFMQALNQKNIPFESHVFQKGGHGLALGKPHTSAGLASGVDADFAQWLPLSVSWLRNINGDFPADNKAMATEAKDTKEYSIYVKMGAMLEHPDCQQLLFEYIPELANANKALLESAKELSLMTANPFLTRALSKDQLMELDTRLKNIPYKG